MALASPLRAGCGGSDNDDAARQRRRDAAADAGHHRAARTSRPASATAASAPTSRSTGTLRARSTRRTRRTPSSRTSTLAPVNARGMVEYSADFLMLKPKDMSKANGVLRYDAPNRGNILTMLNPAAHAGRRGVPGARLRGAVLGLAGRRAQEHAGAPDACTVPIAKNTDGSVDHRALRAELITNAATPGRSTLPGGVFNGTMIPYAPASLDNTQPGYSLTRRINETDPRITIPAARMEVRRLQRAPPIPSRARPDPAKVCLKGGFDPKYLYELVYVAKDPKVMGVGLAALRDTISFFRQGRGRRGRHRQPGGRPHHPHHRPGHVAVGQRDEDLPAPGLQPGAGRRQGVRRHVRPRGGAPDQHQHALRRAGRRRRRAHRPHAPSARPRRAAWPPTTSTTWPAAPAA